MYDLKLMPCRYEMLKSIVAAANKINVPFIGYTGKDLVSAGISDDLGIFYFIPKIAKLFNLPLNQAINAFFYGIISLSFILGFIGFFLLYKQVIPRIVATTMLLSLLFVSLHVGDVYMAYSLSCVSLIPLSLYFIKQQHSFLFVFLRFNHWFFQ
jgi:hypothetical protein